MAQWVKPCKNESLRFEPQDSSKAEVVVEYGWEVETGDFPESHGPPSPGNIKKFCFRQGRRPRLTHKLVPKSPHMRCCICVPISTNMNAYIYIYTHVLLCACKQTKHTKGFFVLVVFLNQRQNSYRKINTRVNKSHMKESQIFNIKLSNLGMMATCSCPKGSQ